MLFLPFLSLQCIPIRRKKLYNQMITNTHREADLLFSTQRTPGGRCSLSSTCGSQVRSRTWEYMWNTCSCHVVGILHQKPQGRQPAICVGASPPQDMNVCCSRLRVGTRVAGRGWPNTVIPAFGRLRQKEHVFRSYLETRQDCLRRKMNHYSVVYSGPLRG